MKSRTGARGFAVLVAATAMLAGFAPAVAAQATGTIRGSVVGAGSERPLNGVQVSIQGTTLGTVTDARGEFLIVGVPAGEHQIRVSYVGYGAVEQTVAVAAGDATEASFELAQTAIALDELVVTGTPGATSRRTLGNAVTSLNASEVTEKSTISSLSELLQAKTPGVQILPNSGVPGAASDIRIRGAASLVNLDPVVYVDGIRYDIGGLGTFTPSGAGATSFGGQTTSAFDFINPADIESIEVIKGPAAATLYGAEAANGVIQIITKTGTRGEQDIQWNLRLEQGVNQWSLPIPDNFTTCNDERISEVDAVGAPVWPGCQGVVEGTVITQNPLLDDPLALRDGDVQRATLSMRGGGERYSFYLSGVRDTDQGVFRNSYSNRHSLRANFGIFPNDVYGVQITASYAQQKLRMPVGDESAQAMLLSAFRGRPGRVTGDSLNAGWGTTRPEQQNAYDNTTRSDRLTLGTTVNLTPAQWFRNQVTLGFDYTGSLAQVRSPAGSTDAAFAGVPQGFVSQRVPRTYVYSLDYSGNIEQPLGERLVSTTSVGMQANSRRTESVVASGTGFGAPDVELIGAATSQSGSNSFSEQKSLGFFAQEQVAWNDRLYVTFGLRADDNSAFGQNFTWLFYPKVSLSWVLAEEPFFGGLAERARLSEFRFRASYGQAGSAPSPFAAEQVYTVDKGVAADGGIISVLRPSAFGNPDLVAERGSEYEIGFDAGLFDDRAGIDFTYYNKRMDDAIISTAAPGSTGFGGTFYGGTSSVLRNLGETHNSGIELGLTIMPLRGRRITWDSHIALATNRNELVSFGDDRTKETVASQSYGTVQEHRAGYPLAGYWDRLPQRSSDGSLVLDDAGNAVLGDTATFIGPSAPKRELSFSNTVTLFRDFQIYALVDYKGGHYNFNSREYQRCTVGTQLNCERLHDTDLASHSDGPAWFVRSTYIEKADFIKLRDLSLTYRLPTDLVQRFGAGSASLTLAGHNLALWSDYTGIDPEVNSYGNRAFARADVYPVPMTRRLSASINMSF